MSSICIIPARGGSKRISKKNIKDFLGKPIISYVIELAKQSKLFDVIVVSTDDEEIASISKSYGAQVPFLRSETCSDDFASTEDVILEVLESYKNQFNKEFDYCCCFYPTGVLAKVEELKEGEQKIKQNNIDTVFPVVPFQFPIWRGLRREDGGKTEPVWPEFSEFRSQDLEKVFHDAGQWYWVNVESFKHSKKLYSENISTILLDPLNVQDIDDESDWGLAELKYRLSRQE